MASTISANIAGGGGLVTSGDASGVLNLQTASVTALSIDASQKVTFTNSLTSPTLTSPIIAGTPTGVGVLTSGTAQASTSGTSILFTAIPPWVKRITFMYSGLSTTATTQPQIQLGTLSGGLVTTSGQYTGQSTYNNSSSISAGNLAIASGFDLMNPGGTWVASSIYRGFAVFTNIGSNTWIGNGVLATASGGGGFTGEITLPAVLDRIAIVVNAGAFDAGTINIMYE